MAKATLVLGCPDRAYRLALRQRLMSIAGVAVVGETGEAGRLADLVARLSPDLVVFDARWLPGQLPLLRRLSTGLPDPRVLLLADRLNSPEVIAAVEAGLSGCLERGADTDVWRRAIEAVLADEPWIPRQMLVQALSTLQNRLAEGLVANLSEQDLTERQRQNVGWVAEGLSNKEIGMRLGISPATVKTHLHNIFERLGVSGRMRVLSVSAGRRSVA